MEDPISELERKSYLVVFYLMLDSESSCISPMFIFWGLSFEVSNSTMIGLSEFSSNKLSSMFQWE